MKISKISKIRQNLSKTKTLGFQNRSSHTERDTNTYKKRENQRERPAIAEDDDLQEGSSTGRHGTDMEFDSIRERERDWFGGAVWSFCSFSDYGSVYVCVWEWESNANNSLKSKSELRSLGTKKLDWPVTFCKRCVSFKYIYILIFLFFIQEMWWNATTGRIQFVPTKSTISFVIGIIILFRISTIFFSFLGKYY